MIKNKKEALLSPLGIFLFFIVVSALVIVAFRLIFPGEEVPLERFSLSWRLIRGLLDYLNLFPALALSSLVIPFGLKAQPREKINPFSPQFLKSLKMSIITAIIAAALYALLFLLALPLARDYETNLRFQSRLYGLSRDLLKEHAAKNEWEEAGGFLTICEGIWPENPELSTVKTEVEIHLEEERVSPEASPDEKTPKNSGLPGPQPVDATEALALAETALAEERYFDAHWLAVLGGRLAEDGSPESAAATRLSGMAWNGVNSLAPNSRETEAYRIYRLKREGHEALLAEEWIRAYYIFLELLELAPDDPDTAAYLTLSEDGLKKAAFFIDEIALPLEKISTGAIFSLPYNSGRLVMKMSSLSISPDSSYAIKIEIMTFDAEGRPLWSMEAPYAKLFPLALDSGSGITLLMRALDRTDKDKNWEPKATGLGQEAPQDAQIALSISWDDFLLLSKIRRGLSALSAADLMTAAQRLGNYGYQSRVFEAELIRRFAEPLFMLPFGIFAIIIGWRYRAVKRPKFAAIPMLGILPLVFNGAVHLCRLWINNLGIWAVVSFGFTMAAVFFGIGILVLLILNLIILAAQHD